MFSPDYCFSSRTNQPRKGSCIADLAADTDPEPVATEQTPDWAVFRANANCRVTHVDARCTIAVMIATVLLRGLLRQELSTEQQINPLIQTCKKHIEIWEEHTPDAAVNGGAKYSVPNSAILSRRLTAQSLQELELDKADGGDVWKCLGAGVFCLRTAMVRLERLSGIPRNDSRKVLFAELINSVVQEGGAAQVNAAFAGALLGAYLGYDAIPENSRAGLIQRNFLMRKSKLLCASVGVIEDEYQSERDSRLYPGRNASERAAMQGTIRNRRRLRRQLLRRRWDDPDLMAERRQTVYGSLRFPRPSV